MERLDYRNFANEMIFLVEAGIWVFYDDNSLKHRYQVPWLTEFQVTTKSRIRVFLVLLLITMCVIRILRLLGNKSKNSIFWISKYPFIKSDMHYFRAINFYMTHVTELSMSCHRKLCFCMLRRKIGKMLWL